MTADSVIKIIHDFVRTHGAEDVVAHDWWHIHRVLETAKKIAVLEGGNPFVVQMIALLHDVYDHKFHPDVDITQEIIQLFERLGVIAHIKPADLENINHSICNLSFKGGFNTTKLSLEGQIAQDADRLDAIGAIAIARTFAYGGKMDRALYDPEVGMIDVESESQYLNTARHSINHFYEKLLKLKDLMNTETGKKMADSRHQFMEQYLEQFFVEWDGTDFHSCESKTCNG